MPWYHYLAYFLGGMFLSNAVPHLVSGVQGRSFQSPFAQPSGKGLSSATVNVLWGAFNLVVGYLLFYQVGHFDLAVAADAASAGLGGLLMALLAAHLFGPFHGGVPAKR